MTVMRLALPVRSPYPLMVPCTCTAPATTAAIEFATAHPESFCVWIAMFTPSKYETTSPTMRCTSWGNDPPLVSHSTR
jgi:hypothetical protein